jgi:nucleoside-diphosphate-sugar epimerase
MAGKALVLGVEGITGSYLREELLKEGWTVVGVSRRGSSFEHTNYSHVSVDLLDREATFSLLQEHDDLTHLYFCAFVWSEDKISEAERNLALLVNGVEAAETASPGLQHVCLYEGGKWYGCHVHPFKTPAYEDDARVMPPIFYYDQQDYLQSRQQDASWTWSALRPEGVGGVSIATPHNFIQVALVYAVICKELGIPLRFPGIPECRDALYEMTDARLLSRAAIFVSTKEHCHGEAFNVTNGDQFRWNQMFPFIADLLKMEYGGTQTMQLTEMMADKGPVWESIVAKYDLTPYRLDELAFWPAGDGIFRQAWDNVRSIIKLRQSGFDECIDSRTMVADIAEELMQRRIIPRY